MFSSEERKGLWWTIGGAGAGLLALTVWLLFFARSPGSRQAVGDRLPTAAALPMGRVLGTAIDAVTATELAGRTITIEGVAGRSDHRLLAASVQSPGRFEVRALPSGRCRIRIAMAGYFPEERDLQISAGATVDLGTVALVPLASISGRVIDAAGDAVGAGAVEVLIERDGQVVALAVPDARSRFEFRDLPPANYALRAVAPTRAALRDSTLTARAIDARRGGAHDDNELRVVPECALSGVLRWTSAAAPPRSIAVEQRVVRVAADGHFLVDGLRAGAVVATVEDAAGGHQSFVATLPCPAVDWPLEALVDDATPTAAAKPSAATPPLGAPTASAPPLFVRVRGADGSPAAVALELRDRNSGAVIARDWTTRAGVARVVGWPIGEWQLVACSGAGVDALDVVLREGEPLDFVLVLAAPE